MGILLTGARVPTLATPKIANGATLGERLQADSDARVISVRNLAVTLSPAQIVVAVATATDVLLEQWDLVAQPVTGDGTVLADIVSTRIRDGVFTAEADFHVAPNSLSLFFQDQSGGGAVWTIFIGAGNDLGLVTEFIAATFVASVQSTNQIDFRQATIDVLSNHGTVQSPFTEFAAFASHDGGGNRNMLQINGSGSIESRGEIPT